MAIGKADLSQKTDEELIGLFQRTKEHHVFEVIYKRYKDKLYSYILNLISYNHLEDAQELLDEVFIKVYMYASRLQEIKAFKVWLYRITRNICLNWLKQTSIHKEFADDKVISQSVDRKYATPEESVLKNERKRMLFKSLLKLDSKDKEIIMLKYYKDFTFDEISIIMKIPKRTLQYRLHNALIDMNRDLKKGGFYLK